MTSKRRMNLSLPEDVAQYLDGVDNASAVVAEAIRARQKSERSRAMLARHGIAVTDDGIKAAGKRLREAESRRHEASKGRRATA